MTNVSELSAGQLRQAAAIKDQIEGLESELSRLLVSSGVSARRGRGRRRMSAAGRARIAAAQRARWAKQHATKAPKANRKPRRKMSAAARKRMAQLARARWAKVKAAGKTRL